MSRRLAPQILIIALFAAGCGDSDQPTPTGPATFAGSNACQDCHAAEFDAWMGSHHQLAMQVADESSVLGDFDDVSFEYFGTTTHFYRQDDEFYVRTAGPSGQGEDFRIDYVFGVEPLQQYLIEFPGGRLQTLAFSWDSRAADDGGQRWFHMYPDEYIAIDDELHWTGPAQNWNYMCAECHSTNLEMNYDAATDSFDTTYSEISVGCESCHGPGSNHIELAAAGGENAAGGFPINLGDNADVAWVMNPETGIAARSTPLTSPQQQPEACGRCHARRGIIAPEYEYGAPLAHTHMPALLDQDLYFNDGQIFDEVYVYGSFLQSKMYQAGVTCTDCHDAHSYALKTGSNPNDVCAQCHLPAKFAAPEHAGHAAEQAGCVDCHMTDRTYMVVDDRRDHSFRIPRPGLDTGSPLACDGCHADQDAAWASAAVAEWRGDVPLPPHYGAAFTASRSGFANDQLRQVFANAESPDIVRATAILELAQPFSTPDYRSIEAALGDANPLLRIAALRQIRSLPAELRTRLPGAKLLADPVRGVRIEAASAYAGMVDLLPLEEARAWSTAEAEFRLLYESIANRPEALAALATFELEQQNIPAAVTLYERSLRVEPRASMARANLADLLRRIGEEGRAEDLLREGIALDPENPALHHALGLSLVRSGELEGALGELGLAAELAPENSRYLYVLGIALNSTGQGADAARLLRAAYARFPGDYDIAMALATILRDGGQQAEALEVAYGLARRHSEDQNVLALLRSLGAVP